MKMQSKSASALLLLVFTCGLYAQAPVKKSGYTDFVAYNLFLKNCAALSRQASRLGASGKDAGSIQRAVATKLGLASADVSTLLAVAVDTDAQIQTLDKQANAIIQNAHKLRDSGMTVPPPPEELTVLQQKKVALIAAAIEKLHNQLTVNGKTAVENYLHTSAAVASSVTATPASKEAK